MNREDIIRMAQEAGLRIELTQMGSGSLVFTKHCAGVSLTDLQTFAGLIAEDCARRCDEIAEVQEFVASTFAVADAAAAIREAYKP